MLLCSNSNYQRQGSKTTFQTAEPWKPETDVRADATMVYGTLDKRVFLLNSVFSRGETRGIRHNL